MFSGLLNIRAPRGRKESTLRGAFEEEGTGTGLWGGGADSGAPRDYPPSPLPTLLLPAGAHQLGGGLPPAAGALGVPGIWHNLPTYRCSVVLPTPLLAP